MASMPPPDSTRTCSICDPSLLAKKRCSRTNSRDAWWVVIPSTPAIASSARTSRSIFSSRLTSKGSRSTGVRYAPTATGAGARRTGWRRSRAEARAIRQAVRAASPRLSESRRSTLANPHAPSTMTRMPTPSSSKEETSANLPSLTVSAWMPRWTTRQSA